MGDEDRIPEDMLNYMIEDLKDKMEDAKDDKEFEFFERALRKLEYMRDTGDFSDLTVVKVKTFTVSEDDQSKKN